MPPPFCIANFYLNFFVTFIYFKERKLKMSSSKSTPTNDSQCFQFQKMQQLFEEILSIQKENRNCDDGMLRVQEIIEESSKMVEKSVSPHEMLIDAKILNAGSSFFSSNVASLNTSLSLFSEELYINGVKNFISKSTEVFPYKSGWESLVPETFNLFKKSNPFTFMLGPLSLQPPPLKVKAKAERQKKISQIENKVLAQREENVNTEEESDVYKLILKCLVRSYKKNNKQPINYFNFVIDPNGYWKTVENIFHFAFLVRDGNVKMSLQNGIPVVEPCLSTNESNTEGKPSSNQFCFSLSVSDWEKCVERFEIKNAIIPAFSVNSVK